MSLQLRQLPEELRQTMKTSSDAPFPRDRSGTDGDAKKERPTQLAQR